MNHPSSRPTGTAPVPLSGGEGETLVARARRPLAATALMVISLVNASFIGIVVGLLSRPWVGVVAAVLTLLAEAVVVRRLKASYEAALATDAARRGDAG